MPTFSARSRIAGFSAALLVSLSVAAHGQSAAPPAGVGVGAGTSLPPDVAPDIARTPESAAGPRPAEAVAPVTNGALAAPAPEPASAPAPQETFIALPPRPTTLRVMRLKPLKMTVGVPPTTGDLGSEADTLDPNVSIGDDARLFALSETWSLVLKGYLRAPLRIGYGQKDDSSPTNTPNELHSPPRMVGSSSSNWAYINIAPNPTSSLRATVSNSRLAATLIISTNTFSEVGYDDLDKTGGIAQGFLTLKFPEAFGRSGGLAMTAGAFGNRYGYAGQNQVNAGYYGTYLFGRTRVVGGSANADFDLNEHLELMVETGFGAELDILPILGASLPKQMYIPGDPHAQLGSDLLYHAHVALWIDDWLKVAGHYLTSWTPNDHDNDSYTPVREARLSVTGAEIHLDHPRWGNGYIGFSHVWGENLFALNDALQVIHGGRGYDFKLQYFGNKLRQFEGSSAFFPNDSGRVETILFQHKFYSNALLRRPPKTRGFMLGLFGMYSHAYSPPTMGSEITFYDSRTSVLLAKYGPIFTVKDDKLKYGVDLLFGAFRNFSFGGRYDRVQPTTFDPQQSYSAVTPYLFIQPDWNSTRRVTVSYTRFFLGSHAYPDSPYSALQHVADPNLFMISALMSL